VKREKLIVENSSNSNKGESAKERAGTLLKLNSDVRVDQISPQPAASGCPICSVYLALAKKGWLRERGELDYKNHLMARHGLEA
jgi:hypothetical protein